MTVSEDAGEADEHPTSIRTASRPATALSETGFNRVIEIMSISWQHSRRYWVGPKDSGYEVEGKRLGL